MSTASKGARRTEVFVGLFLFVSFAYFYQAGGWNQNSRFAMVRAITEEGRLRIDSFQRATGDKAKIGAHYYSDKAPGLSLAAVPTTAIAHHAGLRSVSWKAYLATLLVCGLPVVLAALMMMRWTTRATGDPLAGIMVALVFGVGTPVWAYATLFWGHALALSFLCIGTLLALQHSAKGNSGRWHHGLVIGLLLGWAVLTEYTAVVPACLVAGVCVTRETLRQRYFLLGLVGGAAIALGILLVYNTVAFGGPFTLSYSGVQGFEGMQRGIMGVEWPKPSRLGEITFGTHRGLLRISPILLLAPIGLWQLWRSRLSRDAKVFTALAAYYILLNAGYFYWNGGWSWGPRHLSAGLAFLCMPLALLWKHPAMKVGLVVLALIGVANNLAAVATTPQPPEAIQSPMSELVWPAFVDGDLSINSQEMDEGGANWRRLRHQAQSEHASWNLGQKLGLSGHWSLVPLWIAWALCLAGMFRLKGAAELVGELLASH